MVVELANVEKMDQNHLDITSESEILFKDSEGLIDTPAPRSNTVGSEIQITNGHNREVEVATGIEYKYNDGGKAQESFSEEEVESEKAFTHSVTPALPKYRLGDTVLQSKPLAFIIFASHR